MVCPGPLERRAREALSTACGDPRRATYGPWEGPAASFISTGLPGHPSRAPPPVAGGGVGQRAGRRVGFGQRGHAAALERSRVVALAERNDSKPSRRLGQRADRCLGSGRRGSTLALERSRVVSREQRRHRGPLRAMGSSTGNAFAVGSSGTIVHWNGAGWSVSGSGTSGLLATVWAVGPGRCGPRGERARSVESVDLHGAAQPWRFALLTWAQDASTMRMENYTRRSVEMSSRTLWIGVTVAFLGLLAGCGSKSTEQITSPTLPTDGGADTGATTSGDSATGPGDSSSSSDSSTAPDEEPTRRRRPTRQRTRPRAPTLLQRATRLRPTPRPTPSAVRSPA